MLAELTYDSPVAIALQDPACPICQGHDERSSFITLRATSWLSDIKEPI